MLFSFVFVYVLCLCLHACSFIQLFSVRICFQEYTEEFREIAGKSKKLAGGTIADGTITLINQRHVGDDLPVILFYFFIFISFIIIFSTLVVKLRRGRSPDTCRMTVCLINRTCEDTKKPN